MNRTELVAAMAAETQLSKKTVIPHYRCGNPVL